MPPRFAYWTIIVDGQPTAFRAAELDELRRQIADLQSLKELQELRELRELHPKRLIGNTILGQEFSGGVGGFLGLALLNGIGREMHVAGTLSCDRWRGAERAQLRIVDLAPSEP